MSTALNDERVQRVLRRLIALGDAEDAAGKARVRAREAEAGHKVYGRERVHLYAGAPIAVAPAVGRLLHLLAVGAPGRTLVEFGSSVGFSTIHLAAALRDSGGGKLVTTEWDADKAARARENLEQAGLSDLVAILEGDARVTLDDLPDKADLLFLDGWNDAYLSVLQAVVPRLTPGALVVADLSTDDPACEAYRQRVADPASRFLSVLLPLDEGVVVSRFWPQASGGEEGRASAGA